MPRRYVPCLYKLSETIPGSWWKPSESDPTVTIKCNDPKGHVSQVSEDQIAVNGDLDDFVCPEKDCKYGGHLRLVDYR